MNQRTPHSILANLNIVMLVATLGACDTGGPDVEETKWSYEGENGPSNWGDLDPAWQTCRDGEQQSPIDVVSPMDAESPANLEPSYEPTPTVVLNNGHTIEVEYEPGSTLTIAGDTYELLQFHFHAPSEHEIDGFTYAMEAHLVHANASGELAVLGVLLEEGESNAFLEQFWNDIPAEVEKLELEGELDVHELLPSDLSYLTYSGSLTTPPCSEGVRWLVLETPRTVSAEQVDAFVEIIGDNARPIQALNGRTITRHGVVGR